MVVNRIIQEVKRIMKIQAFRGIGGLLSAALLCLAAPLGWALGDLDGVSADLRARLDLESVAQNLRVAGTRLRSPRTVAGFYRERQFRPLWLNAEGLSSEADAVLAAVRDADREGLRVEDYHQSLLGDTLALVSSGEALLNARQLADLELLLSDAFFSYAADLLNGRVNPKRIDDGWLGNLREWDLGLLLTGAVETSAVDTALASLMPPHQGYQRLKMALALYRELARQGGWPTLPENIKLKAGSRGSVVDTLRQRLRISGDLTIGTAAGEPFDLLLDAAVRRFQRRHGLPDDGVVGPRTLAALNVPVDERIRQLELNLERWRWLPEELGERHIQVNITDFRMSVMENDQQVLDSLVVVGRSSRPTPVFSANMSYLVFSPLWYVPRSIAVKDKLPVLKRDPYALKRQGIRIFNTRTGKEINPGSVNWNRVTAKNFHYRLRQDPGANNALGRVKFMFPNPHSVYLHDTSSRHLFQRDRRTYSSGCVRISEPMALAEYLLRDNGDWNRERIVQATGQRRERSVRLGQEVPVHLLYWTAWVNDDGSIHFRQDIYDRDPRLAEVLAI